MKIFAIYAEKMCITKPMIQYRLQDKMALIVSCFSLLSIISCVVGAQKKISLRQFVGASTTYLKTMGKKIFTILHIWNFNVIPLQPDALNNQE